MKKSLRSIIEERITNLYISRKAMEDNGKSTEFFDSKIDILESVLSEFDGHIELDAPEESNKN